VEAFKRWSRAHRRGIDGRTSNALSDFIGVMKTTSILNHLIETLKDGQEGFRAASEDVESTALKTLFSEYSLQRGQFVGELQSLARTYGESSPEDSGSAAGALHRSWINLKSALAAHDAHAVLAECERGEDSAVEEYRKALAEPDLPVEVIDTIRSQYTEVQLAHDRVRDLRDSMAA
jgi:uncharacterized protein (TIGR02284 family)